MAKKSQAWVFVYRSPSLTATQVFHYLTSHAGLAQIRVIRRSVTSSEPHGSVVAFLRFHSPDDLIWEHVNLRYWNSPSVHSCSSYYDFAWKYLRGYTESRASGFWPETLLDKTPSQLKDYRLEIFTELVRECDDFDSLVDKHKDYLLDWRTLRKNFVCLQGWRKKKPLLSRWDFPHGKSPLIN